MILRFRLFQQWRGHHRWNVEPTFARFDPPAAVLAHERVEVATGHRDVRASVAQPGDDAPHHLRRRRVAVEVDVGAADDVDSVTDRAGEGGCDRGSDVVASLSPADGPEEDLA